MGKQSRRGEKRRNRRHKPDKKDGGSSSSELARALAEPVSGLSSLDAKTREGACAALASMVAADSGAAGSRSQMDHYVRAGMVRRLTERLFDESIGVSVHACGALHNMSIVGGHRLCERLVKDDLMTPLLALVERTPTMEEGQVVSVKKAELLCQVFSLLSNLLEAAHASVVIFTRAPEAFPSVVRAMNAAVFPETVVLAACRLVHTASDRNADIAPAIVADTYLRQLLHSEAVSMPVRLHIAGALVNALQWVPAAQQEANLAMLIVGVVTAGIRCDPAAIFALAERYAAAMATEATEAAAAAAAAAAENAETDRPSDAILQEWKVGVNTLGLSLEVLTNMCSGSEDADGWDSDDAEGWDSEDEAKMDAMSVQQQQMAAGNAAVEVGSRGGFLANAALSCAGELLPQVLSLLQALCAPISLPRFPAALLNDLSLLRYRACCCVTNMTQVFPPAVFTAHAGGLAQVWRGLCGICMEGIREEAHVVEAGATRGAMVEEAGESWIVSLTAAMACAMTESGGGGGGGGGGSSTCDQASLGLVVTLAQSYANADARINATNMLSVLVQGGEGGPEFSEVAGRTITANLEDSHLMVQSAAINSLIDVFGDDDSDAALFERLGVLPAMQTALPHFKAKISAEGHELGREAVEHLKEMRLNLQRFIKYKSR